MNDYPDRRRASIHARSQAGRHAPEEVAVPEADVEEDALVEEREEEEHGDERAADVGGAAGEDGHHGARALAGVGHGVRVGGVEAALEEVRRLVVLAEAPLGQGCPLPGPQVVLLLLPLLRVLEEELHAHEDEEERRERQLDQPRHHEAPPQALLVLQKVAAEREGAVVEHVVQQAHVQRPLQVARQERLLALPPCRHELASP